MNAADLMTSFLPPRDRPDVRSGGKRLGDNPPLVLVRPRPPSTDAGDHLKPADAHHPLRFECRIEITHKSISQKRGDRGAPRRPSERAVTAPLHRLPLSSSPGRSSGAAACEVEPARRQMRPSGLR